jgi:hypothetical protein
MISIAPFGAPYLLFPRFPGVRFTHPELLSPTPSGWIKLESVRVYEVLQQPLPPVPTLSGAPEEQQIIAPGLGLKSSFATDTN